MSAPILVLASTSPRRRQLLALSGWPFVTLPADIDESTRLGEAPGAYALRLAEEKARAASAAADQTYPGALVLASDTTVVDGTSILGKPTGPEDAVQMLRRLRGRTHQVYTAVAVLRPQGGELAADLCVTDVQMREYADEEISAYVASGDPLDKAGAYAVQHPGFHPVASIRGCYPSVMGLPVCRVVRLIGSFGIPPATDLTQDCLTRLDAPCRVYQAAADG